MARTAIADPEAFRPLFEAAARFHAVGCWEWIYDSDLFGVKDPESGQVGYCSIMGNLGEHFALGLYLGSEGLASYFALLQDPPPDDPSAPVFEQRLLMASFEDRTLLRERDRELIRALGLKFRGRNAWPMFRRMEPGYDWLLPSPEEARFLTAALDQAIDVAIRFREDSDLLTPPRPGQYLVRTKEAGAGWHDEWFRPPEPHMVSLRAMVPPAEELSALRAYPLKSGTVELGYHYMQAIIGDGDEGGPWRPVAVMAVDTQSGMILAHELAHRREAGAALLNALLQVISHAQARPRQVRVGRPEIAELLQPVGRALSIEIRQVRALPMFSEARASMFEFMGR